LSATEETNPEGAMNIDEENPVQDEVAEVYEQIEEHLAKEEKEFQEVDEAIREAERKSKNVIRDPEP
jgi:hypothetical protein